MRLYKFIDGTPGVQAKHELRFCQPGTKDYKVIEYASHEALIGDLPRICAQPFEDLHVTSVMGSLPQMTTRMLSLNTQECACIARLLGEIPPAILPHDVREVASGLLRLMVTTTDSEDKSYRVVLQPLDYVEGE